MRCSKGDERNWVAWDAHRSRSVRIRIAELVTHLVLILIPPFSFQLVHRVYGADVFAETEQGSLAFRFASKHPALMLFFVALQVLLILLVRWLANRAVTLSRSRAYRAERLSIEIRYFGTNLEVVSDNRDRAH